MRTQVRPNQFAANAGRAEARVEEDPVIWVPSD
jgi:hypothetical protein